MSLFDRIMAARGFSSESKAVFLTPDYNLAHDPFLLPDMSQAVDRLVRAHQQQDQITIYGDYDIDGLTATALLLDALASFGFKNVKAVIPNRFVEGYGLTIDAVEKIASDGAQLIITVDCGSLSEKEIIRANELGIDVIVTDHHNVAAVQPPAVAVINPKRADSKYPFIDLAGVGVAFKLVQALQSKISGLPLGHEKWLLDLVALGTVCDIVTLVDENRTNVYWGLKVLSQTRRPGLKALMAVAMVDPRIVNSRSLGFSLGPRMNAAGRLETAQHALDMLVATDSMVALEKAQYLDELNLARRSDQAKIVKQAIIQAEKYDQDPVLVVSAADWSHGIVGIVASKLLEKYQKPVFVLQEMGDESKGSARSYGDFSVADAINASRDIVKKGGGHKLAAGVTLPTENIEKFRKRVNDFYKSSQLSNQKDMLLPQADADADLDEITEELVNLISGLEPFGNGNPEPIIRSKNLKVVNVRKMGNDNQHVKLELQNRGGRKMQFVAFGAPKHFFVGINANVTVWYQSTINEWQGNRSVEGRLLHLIVEE
ncbi:single-stranded-DNA-specific exonuclease RecJ [Candidatus Saccharibacteria bacterium CG11_big_fil_rev_8_21_14_0_20_41_19]|nr:single-stranded-DNA-specific exonuclease RecJ [Candidatus Saccharibacteria bacterium]OIP85722.1 MAG: single-stranded-DNA-specific exonuclease RecJ [Candidatus Saccharibacteria bacterium CG2_30_41_52]PIQ70837.1 MAG: single-stranded-DNA-specific exonuclease RecJ [Candidatus Saccharibacteria bacterium CG11_big_fil_rev_8_21_14_0_20_41_19]PIZ60724.1 MAG: single-stranded-DNA-specific exonuclease RecJ [Candidatus Saccharibacteria bacterium CG_4_10_14_0_2_um_filter_41_11]PJC29579.1 MAG: single-stran